MVPLSMVHAGGQVVLCRVDGGHGLLLRLAEMGIRPGARFVVLSKGRPGPYIISFGQARLVIGRGMVHRMFVRLV
jgi:Fe2+ transport system protein FeoA